MNFNKIYKWTLKSLKYTKNAIQKKVYRYLRGGIIEEKASKLIKEQSYEKAKKTLKKGVKFFPKNTRIRFEIAKLNMKDNNWIEAIAHLKKILELKINQAMSPKVIEALIKACKKIDRLDEAEYLFQDILKKQPENKYLWIQYAKIAIYNKDWVKSLDRLEIITKIFKSQTPMDVLVKKSMIYNIMGKHNKAKNVFNYITNNFSEEINKDKKKYRRLIIFDNGETRIEYYKNFQQTDKVIITFDSINMTWDDPPFGFKFLIRQNIDIIAVRKKKKKTYQQDLSQETFVSVVSSLVSGYRDRIAYGFSLGAYASLYFASLVNCRILAISPRLSIHPIYGKSNISSKEQFKHNINLPYNEYISPIILYDPKNRMDNKFVIEEVLESFPNAILVKIPYGGHRIAPMLSKLGLLKEYILTVINGDGVPKYDNRKYRSKSSIYYKFLANECLTRNKLNWANDLLTRSLDILPTDKYAIELKYKTLIKLKKYEDAYSFILQSIKYLPKDIEIRIMLIDYFIISGKISDAEKEIKQVLDVYGDSKQVLEMKKRIEKLKNPNI